ncbi:uncharacterized protein [Linepithema humile]|uniref:uncharacterized protein n=1 Tax=Linepithema humile TaxID=83485 RepID=UPI0006236A6A|nr:PREDICTED: uncharacterized protein LOC105675268 [Linepithema humile]
MDNFERQNTNNTNVIASEAKDFEGNNIPNIITLLLNIYHPKGGIPAYERVLRKVESFLEDCDSRKKQLLLSMIPAPNDVPDHTVKQIFYTTTGFHRLNRQENVSSSKQNFSYNKNASDSKSSLREAFPFRGFPESEISTIYNHTKNVNNLCRATEYDLPRSETLENSANVNANSATYVKQQADPSLNCQLNNNRNNWLNKHSKHQIPSCRQYLLNKKYNVPARINSGSASYLPHSSQTVNQNARSTKIHNNTEIKANCLQNKISQQFNDVEYESKHCKDTCAFDKDKKSDISYMIIDIGQNATIKQTVRNNTHKMDVHWDEDQNVVVDADDLLAPARDKLKKSISNFLKRAQEGVSIELPAFPRTRSYPQMDSSNSIHFTSKDRKSGMSHKILGKDFTSRVSSSDDNSLLFKYQNTDVNLGKNERAQDKETKQGAFTCVSKLRNTKYTSQKSNEPIELQAQRDDSDYITEKKVATVKCEEHDTEESIYGCTITGARSNDVNSEDNFQTHSIFQLAAHKKRYYNTLLNVQKAKVAVTNSLASSSNYLTGYDPYYSNHACQQQKHLFRQQCHLAAEPQFSACSTTLSGLSNVHDNQYSWTKSDCKYLLLKQLKLERQNLPMYVRNQNDWIRRYIGSAHPYSFVPSGNDPTGHCARHKTLEDIVGKLKETERSNVNN